MTEYTLVPASGADYDVFISYAYNDRHIVRRLRRRLQWAPWSIRSGQRMRVFADSTSLAAGNLNERLESALDRSRHLLVVLSPEARASMWVDREIRYWLAAGRPGQEILLCCTDAFEWRPGQPPPNDVLPTALSELRSEGKPLEDLVVDLRWTRRTSRWRLPVDRRWRSPTARLGAAILENRSVEQLEREVQRRQRLAALIAVLICLALGAGLISTLRANSGRAVESQERQSLQFVAQADQLSGTAPDQSAEAAIAGYRTDPSGQTRSALLRQFTERPGLVAYLAPQPATPLSLDDEDFSPDASRMVTVGLTGVVEVWKLRPLSLVARARVDGGGNSLSVRWEPNDRILVVGQTAMTFLDAGDLRTTGQVPLDGLVRGMRRFGDGSLLWYSDGSGFWRLTKNTTTPVKVRRYAPELAGVQFTGNARFAVARDAEARLLLLSLQPGGHDVVLDGTTSNRGEYGPSDVLLTPDGNAVVYQEDSGEVRVRDLRSPYRDRSIGNLSDQVVLGFFDHGRYLMTKGTGSLSFIPFRDEGPVVTVDLGSYADGGAVALSANENLIAFPGHNQGTISVFDADWFRAQIESWQIFDVHSDRAGQAAVAVQVRGSRLGWYLVRVSADVTATLTPLPGSRRKGSPLRAAISPDGHLVAAGFSGPTGYQLLTWTSVSGSWRPGPPVDLLAQPQSIAFSPDGQKVAVGQMDGCVTYWVVDSPDRSRSFCEEDGRAISAVYFSDDGQRLAEESDGQDASNTQVRVTVRSVADPNPPLLTRTVSAAGGFDGLHTVYTDVHGEVEAISLKTLQVRPFASWRTSSYGFTAAEGATSLTAAISDSKLTIWRGSAGQVWMSGNLSQPRGGSGLSFLGPRRLLVENGGYLQVLDRDPEGLIQQLCRVILPVPGCPDRTAAVARS